MRIPDRMGPGEQEFARLRTRVNDILEAWMPDFDLAVLVVSGTLAEREAQVGSGIAALEQRRL